jgi:hypothetical protein
LLTHCQEAIAKLNELDKSDNNNADAARGAWDWIFRSDGFFKEFDDKRKEEVKKSVGSSVQNQIRTLASAVTRVGQAALSLFNVPHKQRVPWEMQLVGEVRVRGYYSRNGFRPQEFRSNSEPLPKHSSLTFEATPTVSRPFKVYWQVVNTGEEARAAGGLRGGFYEGLTERGGLVRNESTLYKDSHWIECFIVKQGVCVARSGEFVVNIQ